MSEPGSDRCAWAGTDAQMVAYHDQEWGVPLHDDRRLFEFMVLDAFQAGLSWAIILRKREAFRAAFDDFDPRKIAGYGDREVERLLGDSGIVRNRAKIAATLSNAAAFLDLVDEHGTFDRYIWSFVEGAPIQNAWRTMAEVPAQTEESRAMSAALRARGFKFVGPTICYAFMQAAGMANDHEVGCVRHAEVAALA